MESLEYRENVLEEIKLNAATDGISDKEAYINYFTNILIEAEELNDFVLLPFEGITKNRKKIQIDGYTYDELDNTLIIISCLFENSIKPMSLSSTDAEKVFSRAKTFVEESMSGFIEKNAEESSPGYGFAIDIRLRYKNVNKYKFYIITDMLKSNLIKEIRSDEVCGKVSEYNIWDIERLHKLFESKSGKEDIVIDLTEFTEYGIPCLPASQTNEYTAYLCNIPGKILGDLYNKFGGRLLEGNVRSFLTTRGKVNKGIRNTILNEPAMFFAFNNGIAATAFDIEVQTIKSMTYITSITSLQIVNGGQTTASLAMALINDKEKANKLENIYVPMKLSVVSPEKSQDLIPNISKFANSQNKVSDADFFSNHQFHIRIENFSRRIIAPAVNGNQYGTRWYYERAKGQYSQEQSKLTSSEKNRFLMVNPKNQMLNKTEFAKYVNLYRMLPHIVSMGAQKNFLKFADWAEEEWTKHETSFNEGFFKSIISIAIMFKQTDKIIKKQEWFESGYKANIIAYTISKLFQVVDCNYPDKVINLKNIWNKQSLSGATEIEIAKISGIMYKHLTDTKREVQNVTEWAKREACWKKASLIDIELSSKFIHELLDFSDAKYDKKEDVEEQKLVGKATLMIEVAKYGLQGWKELKKWGIESKALNYIDIKYLDAAIEMESGKFPSEKQCDKILKVLEKARLESFPK